MTETGKILRFRDEGGFGFIAPDSGGKDIFFHVTGLGPGTKDTDLRPGTRVSYSLSNSDRGLKATYIVLTEAEAAEDYEEYYPPPGPAEPTEEAWRKMWNEWSEQAFASFME